MWQGNAECRSCSPRIIAGDALPESAAGQKLVGDELQKQTRRAANTLMWVSILMYAFGIIIFLVISNARAVAAENANLLLVMQFVIATVFLGLYFWARTSPLPASLVGLVIYCTLIAINVATTMSSMAERRSGIGGLGIGWLDIVIICLLAQGISAGLKHKKLMEAAVRD